MINLDEILEAKHIAIVANRDSFANANALYSYILTMHKKVSLSSFEEIENRFSFLPWYSKVRKITPSTADLVIVADGNTKALYEFFIKSNIKINQKIATSLYGGLLQEYDFFQSRECDAKVFTIASRLIELKADYLLARDFLHKRVPLSLFRVRAILYKSILLKEDAKVAEISLSQEELKATGASIEELHSVLKEVLLLVNVTEVTLYRSEDRSIIKTVKEI